MNRPLSPELEDTARLLDFETRTKLHAHQDRIDHRNVAKNLDGDYSITRLARGLRENDVARIAPQEKHISDQIAEACGRPPHNGYAYVPYTPPGERRDLTVGIGGAGGYLIRTDVAPGDLFIGYVHANSVLEQQGIAHLPMSGNAAFPKVSGTISTYWNPTEASSFTESQFTFAVEAGSPKTLGSYCEISDLWIKSTSPVAQAFVLREDARATTAEFDKKLINGVGAAGEPMGVLNVNGIGSVSGTSVAYSGILDVIKTVENASGIVRLGRAGFVVAPDVAKLLRSRERAAGSGMIMNGCTLADFPCQVSKAMPDGTLIFGDWSQLVLCEWGLLEIGVDPYGSDGGLFKKGLIGLRSIWTIDPVLLHVESFCKVVSIT